MERLAEHEAKGTLGKPNPARAVELLASISCRSCDTYDAMLAAAQAHNGGGALPTLPRRIGIDELGGRSKLLPPAEKVEMDSLVGTVEARGLMAPDGRILYVELLGPLDRGSTIGTATLGIFDPKRLRRLAPYRVEGKPVFVWVTLPPITWDMDGDWTRTANVGDSS